MNLPFFRLRYSFEKITVSQKKECVRHIPHGTYFLLYQKMTVSSIFFCGCCRSCCRSDVTVQLPEQIPSKTKSRSLFKKPFPQFSNKLRISKQLFLTKTQPPQQFPESRKNETPDRCGDHRCQRGHNDHFRCESGIRVILRRQNTRRRSRRHRRQKN